MKTLEDDVLIMDIFVRPAIAPNGKDRMEPNNSSAAAGFSLTPKSNPNPMLFNNGWKRMYWLVRRPTVKDCGNSNPKL